MVQYVREFTGRHPERISGEFSTRGQRVTLSLRVGDQSPFAVAVPLDQVDSALEFGARYVVKATEPAVLAAYLLAIGDTVEATLIAHYCLGTPPASDDPFAFTLIGNTLQKRPPFGRAVAMYEQALSLDGTYAPAYLEWGRLLWAHGRYKAAEEKFRKAYSLDRGHALIVNNIAAAMMAGAAEEDSSRTFRDSLKTLFRRSIDLDPTFPLSYLNLARVYAEERDYITADRYFELAIARRPEDASSYVFWSQEMLRRSQLTYPANQTLRDSAVSLVKHAVRRNPRNALAYATWGDVLAATPDERGAEVKYRKAAQLDTTDHLIYFNWGKALARLGLYDEAIDKYSLSIRLVPRSPVTFARRGDARLMSSDAGGAAKDYLQAKSLGFDRAEVIRGWAAILDSLGLPHEAEALRSD
jgi:tetratricopeptide (TPR) repeat protein